MSEAALRLARSWAQLMFTQVTPEGVDLSAETYFLIDYQCRSVCANVMQRRVFDRLKRALRLTEQREVKTEPCGGLVQSEL